MSLISIVNYALKNGATEAEIVRIETISKTAKVLGEKFSYTSSIDIETIIRVIVGKSIAALRVTTDDEKILRQTVDKAISIAKNSPKDPYWVSLTSGGKAVSTDLKTWSEELSGLDIEDLSKMLNDDYKYIKKLTNPIKIVRISYDYNDSRISIINSNGVDIDEKVNGLFFLIETKGIKEGYEAATFGYTRSKSLDIDSKSVIEDTLKRNQELLNAVKADKVYEGPIAMDPLATATTLFFSLARVITGTSVMEGFSPFKDKLGESIASKTLDIIDNGVLVGGWNSRYFDDEGYPRGKTPIIKEGILKNFLHNSYTSNRLNQENTGNAERRGTSLTVGITNLMLKGKSKDTETLLSSYDEIILVKNMPMNAHTTNYITGALNLVATEVYYVKKGTIEKILKPMTLSGNIYEALKTMELGSDTKDTFFNIITPTTIFRGLKMA